MKLHDLAPPRGAKRRPKRIGRGPGSGHGKTSTKGHKGLLARSGGGKRPGFEGGQMPLDSAAAEVRIHQPVSHGIRNRESEKSGGGGNHRGNHTLSFW